MVFLIKGEIPSKKNANKFNTKTRRIYKDKHYKEWYDNAFVQVMEQKTNESLINKPLKISLKFVHGDLRRRDSDNGTTSIFDLLKDCGIITDDCWQIIRKFEVENGYVKGNACCKVEIEAYE